MQDPFPKTISVTLKEIILMDQGFDGLGSTNNLNVILHETEYAAIRDCINHEKEWN